MFSVRLSNYTYNKADCFFLFLQSSETNVQRNGVGVNAMPSETDSLPQAADRQEQGSSLYLLLNQTKNLFYKNFFSCLQEGINLLTIIFFLCISVTKTIAKLALSSKKSSL